MALIFLVLSLQDDSNLSIGCHRRKGMRKGREDVHKSYKLHSVCECLYSSEGGWREKERGEKRGNSVDWSDVATQ